MRESEPGQFDFTLKLGAVVLAMGVCALAMLTMRQARLQLAHEVAQTQLRIQRADERLWEMRASIASLVSPGRIRELAADLGPMHALVPAVESSAAPSSTNTIPTLEKPAPARATAPAAPRATTPTRAPSRSATSPNAGPSSAPSPSAPSSSAPSSSAPSAPGRRTGSSPSSASPTDTTSARPAARPETRPASDAVTRPRSQPTPGASPDRSADRPADRPAEPRARPSGAPQARPRSSPSVAHRHDRSLSALPARLVA